MMNKMILKVFTFVLILAMFTPTSVLAKYSFATEETTYGQLLDDLEQAQKELNANNQSINNTENQIDENNAEIKSLNKQIEKMSEEATKLQEEIADANIEIEQKKEQTKELVAYLQMSQGENVYLEYVFGSDSITDMVYRLSIVEQITEYNDTMVKELEELVNANEKRKIELAEKEEEHKEKIEELNKQITKLNSSKSKLSDLSPTLEQEVKDKKALVEYYKKLGCSKRSDVIGEDCAVTSTNATFSRPMKSGYVTSFVGYRWGSLHRGIDLGSKTGRNTPLYSIGNGTITSVWTDSYGANCITIQYKAVNGQYYTAIYAHLDRYGPGIYKGMKPKEITSNTIVGYMGDTGKAYGVHLHLEVWPCRYGADSNCGCVSGEKNCSAWNKYVNFAKKMYKNGFKGAESVINFPNRTYTTWYTK